MKKPTHDTGFYRVTLTTGRGKPVTTLFLQAVDAEAAIAAACRRWKGKAGTAITAIRQYGPGDGAGRRLPGGHVPETP